MANLKEGSSGPAVKKLQQQLKDKGFDPGHIDGAFGPGTEAALIAFQKSEGLAADGIAGPRTLAKLAGESSGARPGRCRTSSTRSPSSRSPRCARSRRSATSRSTCRRF